MPERLVVEYTGINIFEVDELNIVDYLSYLRDAFIYKMNQTESGREYLEKAYYLMQTEPDRDALRRKFGKGG